MKLQSLAVFVLAAAAAAASPATAAAQMGGMGTAAPATVDSAVSAAQLAHYIAVKRALGPYWQAHQAFMQKAQAGGHNVPVQYQGQRVAVGVFDYPSLVKQDTALAAIFTSNHLAPELFEPVQVAVYHALLAVVYGRAIGATAPDGTTPLGRNAALVAAHQAELAAVGVALNVNGGGGGGMGGGMGNGSSRNPNGPASQSAVLPAGAKRLLIEGVIRQVGRVDQMGFLPVRFDGQKVTLLLGLGLNLDVAVLRGPLERAGVPLPSLVLDSMTMGRGVVRNVPLVMAGGLPAQSQEGLPPLVGMVGNVFFRNYDVVVDERTMRVRVYARGHGGPERLRHMSCTAIRPMPDRNEAFEVIGDGHPVTAIFETVASYPKMNIVAADSMGLVAGSSKLRPLPADVMERRDGAGDPIKYQAVGVRLALGTTAFPVVPMSVFPELGVDEASNPIPPTMLLNLHSIPGMALMLSNSTRQVCVGTSK
ncbi:MAG: hypothetical protein ACYCVE_16430 [Gemmatimonadaceae bacterium]